MDTATLLAKCDLPRDDVVNIYMVGSRIFGTAKPHSDWDFKVVMKGYTGKPDESIHVDDVNVTIYSPLQFQRAVRANDINVLLCMFLPHSKVWKEEMRFGLKGGETGALLMLPKLKRSVCREATKTWAKAALLWHSDEYTARKCMGHALRYLTFGMQLLKEGRITDYTAANIHTEAILNDTSCGSNFKHLVGKYQPLYERLFGDFKNAYDAEASKTLPTYLLPRGSNTERSLKPVHPPQPLDMFPISSSSQSSSNIFKTIDWLDANDDGDISSLSRLFAITCKRVHAADDGDVMVVCLMADSDDSPLHSAVVQECHGLVIHSPTQGPGISSEMAAVQEGDCVEEKEKEQPTDVRASRPRKRSWEAVAFAFPKIFAIKSYEQRREWEGRGIKQMRAATKQQPRLNTSAQSEHDTSGFEKRFWVCEDVKGKLVILFWHVESERWLVTGHVNENKFWRTWKQRNYSLPASTSGADSICYIFQWHNDRREMHRGAELLRSLLSTGRDDDQHRIIATVDGAKQPHLVLIGARNMRTLKEAHPATLRNIGKRYGWECVRCCCNFTVEEQDATTKSTCFFSVEELAAYARRMFVLPFINRAKGFVVIDEIKEAASSARDQDENGEWLWLRRTRVGAPLYEAVVGLTDEDDEDGANKQLVLEMIRILKANEELLLEGKGSSQVPKCETTFASLIVDGDEAQELVLDTLALTPHQLFGGVGETWRWKSVFDVMYKHYSEMCAEMQKAYDEVKNIEDQKQFAKAAKQYKFSSILFDMNSKHMYNVALYLAQVSDIEYIDFSFKKHWPKLKLNFSIATNNDNKH